MGSCYGEPANSQTLKSPFPRLNAENQSFEKSSWDTALKSKFIQAAAKKCPASPRPEITLEFSNVYDRTDPERATVSTDGEKKYREETRALRRFETGLIELTNAALKSGARQSPLYARCAADWMLDWAKSGAYLGRANAQGEYVRQWGLGVLGNAYLQLQYLKAVKPEEQVIIDSWLRSFADVVIASFEKDKTLVRKQNNHLYWSAWSVTITGVALNERKYYEWGVQKIKYALESQISKEGTLPLELLRGKKALQYHNFALTPMVLVLETASANGDRLYNLRNGIFSKLAANVFQGLKEPESFDRLTGQKQDHPNNYSTGHYAWMEVYNKRYPSPDMNAFLAPIRPLVSHRAGGDVTYLFLSEPKN
jgi:poly(beta-D-mannuronate) lyase